MDYCSGRGACLQETNIVGYPKRNISYVTKFQLVEMEDNDTEIVRRYSCELHWVASDRFCL